MATIHCASTKFENIAAILWDKDGTLADSGSFLKALAKHRSRLLEAAVPGTGQPLLKAFGCEGDRYDPTGLMAVGTRYDNEIAAATLVAAGGKPWADALRLAKEVFADSDRHFHRKADFTPPFNDIAATLKTLQNRQVKQAVLSGDTTSNIQDFLVRYGLTNAVTWCRGSETPPVKPHPQMVWTACKKLAVAAADCLVVGDSQLDQQLAQHSGCRGFISVTWGGSPAIAEADGVLNDPQKLQVF